MKKYLYLILGTPFIIYLLCINSTAAEETNLKEIFLSDAPLKWQRYFDFSTRLEGNILFSQIDKDQKVIDEQITNIATRFPSIRSKSFQIGTVKKLSLLKDIIRVITFRYKRMNCIPGQSTKWKSIVNMLTYVII